MANYTITTSLPGYMPNGDTAVEPFEATPQEAIAALIDEAVFQLGDVFDDHDEAAMGDAAYVESLRGVEGRDDLSMVLDMYGDVSIPLESYANGFGAWVTLRLVR